MPQDSTLFIQLSAGFPQSECYYNQVAGLSFNVPASNITDFQYTVHSDPDPNGKIRVDVLNRSGSYGNSDANGTVIRDRGGDGYMVSNGQSMIFYAEPGCRPNGTKISGGLFTGGNPLASYSQRLGARWLKLSLLPSGTSVSDISQPFAIKSLIVPTGRHNYSADISTWENKSIPMGEFGIPIRRIVHYRTLTISDPGFPDPSYPDKSAYYPAAHALNNPATTPGYFDESRNAFCFLSGFQPPAHTDRARNRGYVSVQHLGAQCSDGTGGYLGSNVGGRLLSAKSHLNLSTLTSYAGCHGVYNGVHILESTGDDIWNTFDQFRFAYKAGYNGNRNLVARVDQLENTNGWARAGLMIRGGIGTGERHVSVFVTPGNGLIFQARNSTNGSTVSVGSAGSVKAPVWLRLEYSNGIARAYYGGNGTDWTQIGNGTTTTFTNYQAGLAAASRSAYPNTSVYSGLNGF